MSSLFAPLDSIMRAVGDGTSEVSLARRDDADIPQVVPIASVENVEKDDSSDHLTFLQCSVVLSSAFCTTILADVHCQV